MTVRPTDPMVAAGALEPLIRAAADEAEAARRFPRAVISAMAEARIFRQMVPRAGWRRRDRPDHVAQRGRGHLARRRLGGLGGDDRLGRRVPDRLPRDRRRVARSSRIRARACAATSAPRPRARWWCRAATGSPAAGRSSAAASTRPGCQAMPCCSTSTGPSAERRRLAVDADHAVPAPRRAGRRYVDGDRPARDRQPRRGGRRHLRAR